MPRKPFQIQAFHGGINSKSDKRDISDTQVAEAIDISIDDIGMVTNAGTFVDASIGGTVPTASSEGYGLFRFSSDYDADYNGSATPVRTDYLLSWKNGDSGDTKKLSWSPDGGNWDASLTHLDTSSDWAGSGETPKPVFYNVDGAIRMSDAGFNSGNNPLWIGAIERTLFTDASSTIDVKGWFKQLQELTAPAAGVSNKSAPGSLTGADRVHWHIRNIKDSVNSIPAFDDASSWTLTDTTGSHLQTESRQSSGFDGASYYRRLGWRLNSEDKDDAEFNQRWHSPAFTNASETLSTGKSAYIALRVENEENRNKWQGTHANIIDEDSAWSVSFTNPSIWLWTAANDYLVWEIELSSIFDTDPGEWVILELPFDEAKYNSGVSSLTPTEFRFQADLSITLSSGVTVSTPSSWTDSAMSVIDISDLRIGDSDKIGSSGAKGVKNFAYSFVYDENEDAESLLFSFADSVSLHPNDYGYKIGVTGHVRNLWTNKRITGANLYMIDEDIPYRIAQLNFIKGLKGSWESEFPADKLGSTVDAFATEHTSGSKSNSIETTGLPLMESYEALNGFKPTVKTIAAKYKTAVVLNRKVYIGNIEQDGKVYGDRMIKSVTNSFDCFPSVGREIDVVINDGDDIIKLETYADRILQFKRNTMYLINATKSAEFLEDTFVGKGVLHPGAVCKTDFGVAWANENGCYLYDGQKVNNLTESVVSETEWATHMNANSQIFYFPSKRKLFVTGDWTGGSTAVNDLYEYSISTQGWTKLDNKAPAIKTNFVLDVDNIVKCVDNSGATFKWDDSVSATSKYSLKTKDIDFGNPATLKRIYRALITWKVDGGGDSNISVKYGTNGEVANTKEFTGGDLGTPSSSDWQVTDLIPDTLTEANAIRSIQLHLGYNNAVPSGFAVNDITLVYRERSLR